MECAPESAGKLALESDMWLLMGKNGKVLLCAQASVCIVN